MAAKSISVSVCVFVACAVTNMCGWRGENRTVEETVKQTNIRYTAGELYAIKAKLLEEISQRKSKKGE